MTEEFDNSEHDDVRRLLAEARLTEPMPDDVASRLDAVLADLARSPVDARTTDEPVVASIAAHRRRRAAGLLVAAAAIVVGGVVVAQQLPPTGSNSPTAAAGASDSSAGGNLSNTGNGGAPRSPGFHVTTPHAEVHGRRVVVRPQHFSADALAGRALIQAKAAYGAQSDATTSCIVAPAHSILLRALFRHAPAVLVYRHPAGSTQVVDLYVCGSTQPVKSVTLPRN